MAWVEAKGSGFRVRHRNPDGTIDTENGFTTRPAATARAAQINAETAAATETATPHQPTAPATPAAPPSAPLFTAPPPAPRRPAPRPRTACPTLREWVHTWAPVHTVAPATAAKYDSLLRQHILPALGDTPLDQITRIAVKAFGNQLHTRMASSSADSIMALLSTVLNEAVANRLIPANPCLALRLSRRPAPEKHYATPLQVLHIAARLDPRPATLVITAAYTGMRWGELAGLAWTNVHLDQDIPEIRIPATEGTLHEIGGKLFLDAPKTDSAVRAIALPPFLATLLTAERDRTRTDFVFTTEHGDWLRRSNFRRRVWQPALEGDPTHPSALRHDPILPGMTFHGLRHSHKTWMKEDGIDPFVQDKRLGHATPGIGARYSHVTPTMIQNLLAKLEHRYHTSTAQYTAHPHTA